MEIKQLEYFRTIVDAGTISGAAKALHMSQPPLSYQMKMLEEELGVQLFLRGMKKIILTEAGKTLYARAGSLLTMADITKREVVKASQAVTIHIGLTPSTVSMMAEYLIRFSGEHPDIRFDIHDGSTFTLKDQLENRMVDITTLRTPIALNGCETAENQNFVPEGEKTISLQVLSRQRLILSNRYRQYILNAFQEAGLGCDIYYECEDARTALTIAEKGLGVAILPASMKELTDKIQTYDISGADLTTEILLAWRKGSLSKEVQTFLEMW